MFDKQKSIEEKNRIQNIAVKGSKGFSRMLLDWATGCGKSLASLKIMKDFYDINPNLKGYLICSESNHLDNWKDDIKVHKMEFIYDISTMFLYASLHKYADKGHVDFVILDEVHHLTDIRVSHLEKIIGPDTKVIMLSATVSDNKGFFLRQLVGPYGIYNITISEAIAAGILPHPKVIIHKFKLDDEIRDKELTIKKDFTEYHTIYNLTEKGVYDKITQEIDTFRMMYEENGKNWMKNLMVNTGSQRKRLLAEFKTGRAKQLIRKELIGSRHIIFTGSKNQAELIGKNHVHSGIKKSKNNETRIKFNKKRLKSLVVVNMFREGMNLVDIEKGLVIQLDNTKLSFIQMLGRVFRSDFPEMHVMVFKDTVDEYYLGNVMKGFNEEYVKYINYE